LTGPRNAVSDQQQQILGDVIGIDLKDPEAIPDLTALLDSYSVPIRRGAAQALRRTESPKAINGLIKALEDTDSQVRYWGVVGLAEATGQDEWRPNEETFKPREPDYLSHWKEWARKRR
jgi:HEAT repeat protein